MFETAMLMDLFEKLQQKAHKNSADHGFWEGPENNNIPTKLCLIHSEVSEWLEAYRKGVKPTDKTMPNPTKPGETMTLGLINGAAPEGTRPLTNEEEEAADVLIRLMDLCEYRNIDLIRVTLAKMHYNESRPYLHGGKKC